MDDLSSIYSEKKLAYYETTYKEGVLAKPQDINIAVTAAHLYGLAFICEQVGTKEGDPEYTRFSCGLEEITKVYINNNNRNSPIYIQCDDTSKSVMNRKRIILPSFNNNEEIVKVITSAKAEFDKKADKQRENEHNKKVKAVEESKVAERERLKKAADAEFESMTADYKKPEPVKKAEEEKPKAAAPDFSVADMLGIEDIVGISEAAEEVKHKEETKADFDEIALPVDTDDLPDAEEVFKVDIPEELKIEAVPEVDVEEEERKAEEAARKKAEEIENYKGMYVPKKNKPAEEEKPAPAEEKPAEEEKPKPAPAPVPAPAPAPAPVEKKEFISQEEYKSMTLEEFQTAVMKLKAMLDSGVMTDEEFAAEKAKLLKCLY